MERIEINPPAWKMALLVLGLIAFVLIGLLMVVFGGDLFVKGLGVISIVFFGGVCGYGLYARGRGQGKVAILPAGVEVGLPGMSPRLLPWGDIEAFGVSKIGNNEFTTIRLRSYRAWLSGVSPQEASATVRFFRGLGGIAHTTARVVEVGDPAGEGRRLTEGSTEVRSLAGVLAHNREKYGGEFLLGWTMRDRGARQFAEFLEQCRRNSPGHSAHSGGGRQPS
jgi:hypothetical protein